MTELTPVNCCSRKIEHKKREGPHVDLSVTTWRRLSWAGGTAEEATGAASSKGAPGHVSKLNVGLCVLTLVCSIDSVT